ncbi:unnamed protein product [Schistosoma margrebowiei]|uniref:Uncharacterized protein n=1 Tax=Schistosoma margrebowiei TaxID=48269 RepID=A0A183N4W4_9TREM|nr:unnamed protein product [Schistosoma margrebowiei]
MQKKTDSVAAPLAAVGLNIQKRKSMILRYNTACTSPITIDGKDLDDVQTLTYKNNNINLFSNNSLLHEACQFTAKIKSIQMIQYPL